MDGEPIIAQVATKIDWKPLEKSMEKLAQTCEGKYTFIYTLNTLSYIPLIVVSFISP